MLKGKTPLRMVAADDSPVMRSVRLRVSERHALDTRSSWSRIELYGVVSDGAEALDAVERQLPDVLVLDVDVKIPRLEGLDVLRKRMVQGMTASVMLCSAHTESDTRTTLEALALGAKDYVMKPGQQLYFAPAMTHLPKHLIPKIAMPGSKCRAFALQSLVSGTGMNDRVLRLGTADVVVIAASTNSPLTLVVLLHLAVPLTSCMPSANDLFRSDAGLDGARAIHAAGGTVLAQDEASSAIWGRPARVIDADLAPQTVPMNSLARAVCERVEGLRPVPRGKNGSSLDEEARHDMY